MPSESSIWNPGVDTVDQELRNILQDASAPTTGLGYVAFDEEVAYQAGSAGKALKDLALEVDNIVAETTVGYTSILVFGAVGDGVTDDSAAFADALAATDRIYLPNPPVAYLVNTPIAINASNVKFLGESRNLTKVRASSSSLPVFAIGNNLNNVELNTLKLERALPATATGTGVECSGVSASHYFRDLNIEGQWDGMLLGETANGQVVNCLIQDNYGHGIHQVTGVGAYGVWDIRDGRCINNNGDGVFIEGSGAAANTALGSIVNMTSVFNTGYGLRAVGAPSKKLDSLRVSGGVFSFNNSGGQYLDTYGTRHRLEGLSANLSGTVATGRLGATIASNQGSGIDITANNVDLSIIGSTASDNSHNGMKLAGSLASLVGNACLNNGANTGASVAARSGMQLATGTFLVQGCTLTNRISGSGTQQHGIHITDGLNCIIDGNNLSGNMVSGLLSAGVSTTNRITNNTGHNNTVTEIIVAGASPWTYTAGNAPEYIYLKGGTFTNLVSDTVQLATAAVAATAYHLVPLEPNQAFTLTYSAAPTVLRKKR